MTGDQTNRIQGRLLILAAIFLFLYSLAITLSPTARMRSVDAGLRLDHWLTFALWIALVLLAHAYTIRWLPDRDPYLLPVASLLVGFGCLQIWRLLPYFGLRQTIWMLVAFVLFIIGLRLPADLGFLRRYKYLWLSGGLLLTALTLLFGTNPAGVPAPRLWLGCCGVYFQPSEPLKLFLIVYLAAYLSGGGDGTSLPLLTLSNRLLPLLTPTLIMTGLALLLLVVQRDLGTAIIFLFLYTAIVYIATGKRRVLLLGGTALLIAGLVGYLLFDVVRLRIDAWINPWLDPSGRSYQIVQSLIAVANGGLFGRGPGMGNPGLVPVPHSDFIFAALIEETGLAGGIALFVLLAIFAGRGLRIALHARDRFGRYLAAGLTAFLVGQSILIIGGNLRLLPLTGVTLPFVSYGGSSLLTSMFSLLLLLLISNTGETEPAPLANPQPYLRLGVVLFAGLGALALATGWWTFYRGPALLARTDNPRRAIADQTVYRGALLDRNNKPLVQTSGEPGSYERESTYSPLSPILGYTNIIYGQSGLEESLDSYLRGQSGNPGSMVLWNQILYGQPPPGLDVRLSLDLDIQRIADGALDGIPGAAVLLDAQHGDILAMASHPYFDSNRLEQDWEKIVNDPSSPLLNRTVQGRYPLGKLETFLFPQGLQTPGITTPPDIRLPPTEPLNPQEATFSVSPLQAALAAAALSNEGVRPAPLLVEAVNTPTAGWMNLSPLEEQVNVLSPAAAADALTPYVKPELSIWETNALVQTSSGKPIAWYVGGTLSSRSGRPLAVAVVLEADELSKVQETGRRILSAAMQ